MNILTIYSADASKLLEVLDQLSSKKGIIKVMASDPARLFNNDTTCIDEPMASITFMCDESREDVEVFINNSAVFVCDEDVSDW